MKTLLVDVDAHLVRTPDGRVWSDRIYTYEFFARYLVSGTQVIVETRIQAMAHNEGYPFECTGERVSFADLPDYLGPADLPDYLGVSIELCKLL